MKIANESDIKQDNRMLWIRDIERPTDDSGYGHLEIEFTSDSSIPGIFHYAEGRIKASLCSSNIDRNRMYHYLLVIEQPSFDQTKWEDIKFTRDGYFFSGGAGSEILCLISLFFQARIFPTSISIGRITEHGIPQKSYFPQTIDVIAIKDDICEISFGRNFSIGFNEFLDKIRRIPVDKHLAIALSAYNYAEALRQIGICEEMAFIRLVSSIEILSQKYELKKDDDLFAGKEVTDYIKSNSVDKSILEELSKIFNVRKSKLKFVRFLQEYGTEYLKESDTRADHISLNRSNYEITLKSIYDARSNYLHSGAPMYTSDAYRGNNDWDFSPDCGKCIDQRYFREKDQLPYSLVFQRIVRLSIIKYIDSMVQE